MNSLLIATFHNEVWARHAMKKLDDLALNGDIDLYERTLVRTDAEGRCEVFKGDVSAGWETIVGAALGSFVGLLGGPIGSVIGLFSGAVVGSGISDRDQHEFGRKFLNKGGMSLRPGTVAIVAHLGERSTALVDSMLKCFDANVVRTKLEQINEILIRHEAQKGEKQ